ncbi:hypothetical protein [Marilutibacter chinensis]|nr:hypothetical protein [Lysobacter chinensis]
MLAMARSAGFDIHARLAGETWLCRTSRPEDGLARRELEAIVGRGGSV